MRWLPIDSAPKDGTFILGWRHAPFWPNGIFSVVAYDETERDWTDGVFRAPAPHKWMRIPPLQADDEPDGLGYDTTPTPEAPEPMEDDQ